MKQNTIKLNFEYYIVNLAFIYHLLNITEQKHNFL